MKRLVILICLSVVVAGCPMDSSAPPHSLSIQISDETTDDGFKMEASVVLEGRPPTDIVYHGVQVTVINDSTTLAKSDIGNITTERWSVPFNISLDSRPNKLLIMYDKVSGADSPGNIQGYRWNPDQEVYEIYTNYTSKY